jgi:hypothetical protein
MKARALVVGIAALLVAACGQQSPSAPLDTARTSSTDAPDPTSAPQCDSGDLEAELVAAGSAMSQPFVSVKLHNRSINACRLEGYAGLRGIGHGKRERNQRLRLDVRHGSVYERPDPPARPFVLDSGVFALFDVSTGTAYPGPPRHLVITRLLIRVPGSGAPLPLRVRLPASHPPHRPIPIRTTAFVPFVGSDS